MNSADKPIESTGEKTAVNSSQSLRTPRNSTWTMHDRSFTRSSHLTWDQIHGNSIKSPRYLQAFPLNYPSITALFRCLVPRTFEKQLSNPALGTNYLLTLWVTVKLRQQKTLTTFYILLSPTRCASSSYLRPGR